jgi:UDPglucose 6-dehydrogenase/GDP-mannose 6-dehydrogenase
MHVTVVGTGYVGLVTGTCLASVGHQVRCVEILPDRVAAINRGEPGIHEPNLEHLLEEVLGGGRLRATTDLAGAVTASEVTLVAVGTPFVGEASDLSQVAAAAAEIGRALRGLRRYHVVAVKSTVLPGTTDTLVRTTLEMASGKGAGEFGLCMNPEFLREGSAVDDFMDPDRIIVGQWDERSGRALAELYEPFDCPKTFTTLRNAELIKYAANALLATLISFSNEMAGLCESTPGTDVEVVMEGLHLDRRLSPVVANRRISPGILSYLKAGCGFGGSCLIKDVNALRAYARGRGATSHVLDAVMAVNSVRPAHLVGMVEEALGSLRDARVAVLGLAFKPGTGDVRDSPSLRIIEQLRTKGASVRVYDPVVYKSATAALKQQLTFGSSPGEVLCDADAAVVATAWPEFSSWDWRTLCQVMRNKIIVDGRNALGLVVWPEGVTYLAVGRRPGKAAGLEAGNGTPTLDLPTPAIGSHLPESDVPAREPQPSVARQAGYRAWPP